MEAVTLTKEKINFKNIKKYIKKEYHITLESSQEKLIDTYDLIKVVEIHNEKDITKKYNLIYDYMCEYLDQDMREKNYCDFQDGTCIANRKGKSVHEKDGCCYHRKHGLCKFQQNNMCTNKNPSCKIFMCDYLEKKGVKYDPNKILPLKLFLNHKQYEIITRSYFKTKEDILNNLLKNR